MFCLIPAAWLPINGGTGPLPQASWHATPSPDGTLALLEITGWPNTALEDAWRATPGVILLPDLWDWGKPGAVPAALRAVFVKTHGPRLAGAESMSMADFAKSVRDWWPHLRH